MTAALAFAGFNSFANIGRLAQWAGELLFFTIGTHLVHQIGIICTFLEHAADKLKTNDHNVFCNVDVKMRGRQSVNCD